jgi:uncharacterized protein YsxB (DUF464 family)
MIRIKIIRDEIGKIRSFFAQGHSDFSYSGKDIVCAAVSALLQSAVLGLTHHLPDKTHFSIKEGDLACSLRDPSKEEEIAAQAILQTLTLSLYAIKEIYPKHIFLEEKKSNEERI